MKDPRDEPPGFNPVEHADEQRRAREDAEWWANYHEWVENERKWVDWARRDAGGSETR